MNLYKNYITTTKIMCDNVSNDSNPIRHNISIEQRRALQSLSNDKSINIKEADKGGGLVIINVQFYKSKILQMINDETYYKTIP